MYIRKLQLIAGKSLLRLSAAEVFVFIDIYSKDLKAKLTEEIVLSIYNEPKELTNREVSNKYGVPYERVRLIRNGEVWKSVTQTQGSTTSRKA